MQCMSQRTLKSRAQRHVFGIHEPLAVKLLGFSPRRRNTKMRTANEDHTKQSWKHLYHPNKKEQHCYNTVKPTLLNRQEKQRTMNRWATHHESNPARSSAPQIAAASIAFHLAAEGPPWSPSSRCLGCPGCPGRENLKFPWEILMQPMPNCECRNFLTPDVCCGWIIWVLTLHKMEKSSPPKKSSKIKRISANSGKTTKDIDLWQLCAMAMAIVLPMSLPGLEARNLQLRQGPGLCAIEVVHHVLTCFKKNHGIMEYHMISYDIMMISRNILGCHGV